MAYDGAIALLVRARRAVEEGRADHAAPHVFRAKRIVLHLLGSLDPEAGDVALNLRRLYTYVVRRLAEAAIGRDARALDDALHVLRELRGAWAKIDDGAAPETPSAEREASAARPPSNPALSVTG